MLRQPFELPLSREMMRQRALQFYYVHNLHGTTEALSLRTRFGELFKVGNDASASPEALASSLAAMCAEPAWSVFVQELIQDMRVASARG